jgi:phasin
MADDKFEIPQSLRDLAARNVDQAKQAYDRFIDATRQAQEMMSRSSSDLTSQAKQIQQRAFDFAQANSKAGFELADRLAKAKTLQEAFELQTRYAREQMEAYAKQAQEMSRLMAETVKPK